MLSVASHERLGVKKNEDIVVCLPSGHCGAIKTPPPFVSSSRRKGVLFSLMNDMVFLLVVTKNSKHAIATLKLAPLSSLTAIMSGTKTSN